MLKVCQMSRWRSRWASPSPMRRVARTGPDCFSENASGASCPTRPPASRLHLRSNGFSIGRDALRSVGSTGNGYRRRCRRGYPRPCSSAGPTFARPNRRRGSRVWSIGPTMTVPLFTAGRISNTVKGFEARQQQAATQYLQTIQQAFREVEDALVFHRKVREVRTERERRVAASRRALALVTLRYERGLSTQLEVLDAQRQLFSAELDLASTTRDQLTAVVQLYKALGGGWQSQPPAGHGQSQ